MSGTMERRAWCEHGTWAELESSLSRIWCDDCGEMVECEIRL